MVVLTTVMEGSSEKMKGIYSISRLPNNFIAYALGHFKSSNINRGGQLFSYDRLFRWCKYRNSGGNLPKLFCRNINRVRDEFVTFGAEL